jgi:hypothetical protein
MNSEQSQPNRGKFVFIGILLILLIIGISISWFLIIKPAITEEVTPTAPAAPATTVIPAAPAPAAAPQIIKGDITIADLKFCSNIDEAYDCTEQPNAEFSQGSKIYILMTIAGYQRELQPDGNYLKHFAQSIKTTDSNGSIVPELTGNYIVDVYKIEQMLPEEVIPIMNSGVLPASYPKGEYIVKMTVYDVLSGHPASKTTTFKLV